MARYHDEREHRRRSRSPGDRHEYERDHKRRRRSPSIDIELPYNQRKLDSRDFQGFQAVFASYLDVHKRLDLDTLDQHEAKGRWKSFLGKWNRGELAEGWYDPSIKVRFDKERRDLRDRRASPRPATKPRRRGNSVERQQDATNGSAMVITKPNEQEDDDDKPGSDSDDFGPAPPRQLPHDTALSTRPSARAAVPSLQDLQLRREQAGVDRQDRTSLRKEQQKVDRKAQKERLEELVPRAEPGSRERKLEKKREVAAGNRAFREARSPGVEDVDDKDLLGDGGIDSYKAEKRAQERKKNEREIRKEEVLRARAAEREEKLAEHRKKEEKTMAGLIALAKQRYG